MDNFHAIIMGSLALTGMATILVVFSMALHDALQRWYDRGR